MIRIIHTATLDTLRADLELRTSERDMARRLLASAGRSRQNAWTFILAAKREGLIPNGAWSRRANSFTASESEGDIEDDCKAADVLRASLTEQED